MASATLELSSEGVMQAGLLGVLANGNEEIAKSLALMHSRAAQHGSDAIGSDGLESAAGTRAPPFPAGMPGMAPPAARSGAVPSPPLPELPSHDHRPPAAALRGR